MRRRQKLSGSVVEVLEPRRMFVVFAVSGTGGDDTIIVNANTTTVTITVNGTPTSQAEPSVTGISVDGLGGSDLIRVLANFDNPTSIFGGSGNDTLEGGSATSDLGSLASTVRFDGGADFDLVRLNDQSFTGPANYTVTLLGVQVEGFPVLEYGAAEQLVLNGSAGDNGIFVTSLSVPLATVSGNGGNDSLQITPTSQNVAFISSNLTFDGGLNFDAITLSDQNGGAATRNYLVSPTQMNIAGTGGGFILPYLATEAVRIFGSSQDNALSVSGMPSFTTLEFDGRDGNDEMKLAEFSRDYAALGGNITVSGGLGVDSLSLIDDATTTPRAYTLVDSTITSPGLPDVLCNDANQVALLATNGDNAVDIDHSTFFSTLVISANGGNDTIFGSIDDASLPVSSINAQGGPGSDIIVLEDLNNTFADTWTITASTVSRMFFAGLTYSDAEALRLSCGPADNRIDVNSTGVGVDTRIAGGGGADEFFINSTATANPVGLDGGPGLDDVTVGAAAAYLIGSQDLDAVAVPLNGGLFLGQNLDDVVRMSSLSLGPFGILDVRQGTVILDYAAGAPSPIDLVASRIAASYNGGMWNNTGITSGTSRFETNTGVGYADATEVFTSFPAMFAGTTVDNSSVLFRYTLYGDANLNRKVSIDDFSILAANFNRSPLRWAGGDFNFNLAVTISDFSLLASNFNLSLPFPRPAFAGGRLVRDVL